ncbi:DNA polymerase delta subunit 3-like [Adelges cooleyi]|uniref:DNA polymerase delta subunit 3-like n=1 Tax=Adelges cooleyi TaxID=133065 RepID=UPI0021807ECE|nr:DNA polymerase delta subunit 3-like [Adelges cooleyi]
METKLIDEILEDKQQIVTYKTLTKMLNIHPNKAKQLLKDYICKISDSKKYSVTVVIGGSLKEKNEFCIVLSYDNHVETIRRRFKNILFEQIYSIQPIGRFTDLSNDLYLAEQIDENFTNICSSIRMKNTKKVIAYDSVKGTPMEIDETQNKETKQENECKEEENLKEIFSTSESKKTIKKPQKNKNDFFKTNTTQKTEVEPINKKMVECKKTNSSTSDFFIKLKSPECENKDVLSMEKEQNKKDVCNMSYDNETVSQSTDIKKKVIKKDKTKKRKANNESLKKHRKRIQTFNSSDEEEINSEEEDNKRSKYTEEHEEVDFVLPTPPRPTIRENLKKEKQVTTSTYIDDDGFVCTNKEVKIVENEIPDDALTESINVNNESTLKNMKTSEPADVTSKINKKKSHSKLMAKNNSSVQGKKQTSLTSFFKVN